MMTLSASQQVAAPDLIAYDQDHQQHTLDNLVGEQGLLLGFVGDIWKLVNVRRVLWFHRHGHQFDLTGLNTALVAYDDVYTLYDFHITSPIRINLPLLSDPDGMIHERYGLDGQAGLVLINREYHIRHTWRVGHEQTWPDLNALARAIRALDA